jgi:hypothetical protein
VKPAAAKKKVVVNTKKAPVALKISDERAAPGWLFYFDNRTWAVGYWK